MSGEITKTQVMQLNSAKIKNLQDKNEVELEKIKLGHNKNKLELRNQNKNEIITLNNQLDQKKLIKLHENEKTLEKVKENLDLVKAKTETERVNLAQTLKEQKANQMQQFNNQYSNRSTQQKLKLEDLEQSFSSEIRKLDRELKNKKQEVSFEGRNKIREIKSDNKNSLSLEKDTFRSKKNALDDTHHIELESQEKRHKNYLSKQEYQFQKKTNQRKGEYDKIVKSVENDGQSRNMNKQALFEKKYNELSAKHESIIAKLNSRKDDIINNLKNDILETHEINYNNTRDPFYTKTTLNTSLTKLPNRDFELIVEVPESEKDMVKVTVQQKEIKLSYDRDFQNKIKNQDGSIDKINKVETISKTMNVDEVLDSNKVFKKYENGHLHIHIKRA